MNKVLFAYYQLHLKRRTSITIKYLPLKFWSISKNLARPIKSPDNYMTILVGATSPITSSAIIGDYEFSCRTAACSTASLQIHNDVRPSGVKN